MLRNRKSRRATRVPSSSRFVYRPSVESCEKRQLLATVAPLIQGSVFIDTVGNGVRTTSEVGLAGATVSLFAPGGTQPIATTTTGTDGGYLFNSSSLTVGTTYTVVENSPVNFASTGAQALSQVDPAKVVSANSIQLTVVDPNKVVASFLSGVAPYDDITYTLNGTTGTTAPTPLNFALTANGATLASSPITALCVGLTDNLSYNTPFATVIDPQSALPNGGEIAYLYNHYGLGLPPTSQLPTAIQPLATKNINAGLQLAIWELEYGSALTISGPTPGYNTSAQDFADLSTAAAAFIADATGKSEKVAILDASLTGSLPQQTVTPGGQSILAAQSFNFGVTPVSPPGIITGTAYLDSCGTGLSSLNPKAPNSPMAGSPGEPGVTIKLAGPNGLSLTTTTDSNGNYSFAGLAPGTYTVTETTPAGLIATGPASGSYSVTLTTAAPRSSNDNFANFAPINLSPISNIQYVVDGKSVPDLRGATHQGSVVQVSFTVAPNASAMLSLVGYTAPAATFSAGTASQQQIVALQSGTYGPGQHTLTITLPDSYYQVDFVAGCPITMFGPAGSNIFYSAEGRLLSADNGGTQTYATDTLGGLVYADLAGTGVFALGDTLLAGVSVTLTGTTSVGVPVPATTTTTAANGTYSFAGLAPGTYTVVASTPTGYVAETANVGSVGGSAGLGSVGSIALDSNTAATGYNFGEVGTAISGTVYLDGTGNGFSPDDAPLPGVTVSLVSGTTVVASTTSGANGTYSFTGLPAGSYTVRETAPTGDTQTGPISTTYAVTTSATNSTSTGNNFDNFAPCPCPLTNIIYTSSSWGSGTTLVGHTRAGDTVTATFTVGAGSNATVSLVSYVVPDPSNPSLTQQVEFSLATGSFAPGTHTVSVKLPTGAYQVDFVCGPAIDHFGPTGSNIFYHAENRFYSSDTEGSTPSSAVAPPLANLQSDVGCVGTPGTLSYTNGTYTLTGSGSDIWNNADAFNYVYQTLNGDGEIVARVDSVSNTDSWAKAGVMIRQSLDPSSPQASVFLTAGNGVVFQDRNTDAGCSTSVAGLCTAGPVWVKLVRSGTTLAGFDSTNGVNWQYIGSDTIPMNQSVDIGLAVTAHNNSLVSTATFDAVTTQGYWASLPGQSLIQSFNGGPTATALGNWLATTYPNLYGSAAGSNNLAGLTNAAVATYVQSLASTFGPDSLEAQTFATALTVYATTTKLGGGASATTAGFTVTTAGFGATVVNVWGSGVAFGVSNNSNLSIAQILSAVNNQAVGGVLFKNTTANRAPALMILFLAETFGYTGC